MSAGSHGLNRLKATKASQSFFSGMLRMPNALNSDGVLTPRRLCSQCLKASLPKMSKPSNGNDIFPGATSNKSLDASGGGVFRNLIHPAEGALMRAAASTQPLAKGPILARAHSAHNQEIFDEQRTSA